MTSFSAEIKIDEEVLDVTVEILDSLPVGMEAIKLGAHQPWCGSCYRPDSDLSMWMDDCNFGTKPNKWLEDAYSLRAAYVLSKCAPYYGDQFAETDLHISSVLHERGKRICTLSVKHS